MTRDRPHPDAKENRDGVAFSWLLRILAAAAVAGLVWWVWPSSPTGPVPVAWDREPCAQCRMHIGDPSFAAQMKTMDGRVLNFDDPGCLATFLESSGIQPARLWFHHFREDAWLSEEDAAFIRHDPTPMGYGYVAVSRDTPGAIPWTQASAEMRRKQ